MSPRDVATSQCSARLLTRVLKGGDELALVSYPYLASARDDRLERLDRREEARDAFERAVAQTRKTKERDPLIRRARACDVRPPEVWTLRETCSIESGV